MQLTYLSYYCTVTVGIVQSNPTNQLQARGVKLPRKGKKKKKKKKKRKRKTETTPNQTKPTLWRPVPNYPPLSLAATLTAAQKQLAKSLEAKQRNMSEKIPPLRMGRCVPLFLSGLPGLVGFSCGLGRGLCCSNVLCMYVFYGLYRG